MSNIQYSQNYSNEAQQYSYSQTQQFSGYQAQQGQWPPGYQAQHPQYQQPVVQQPLQYQQPIVQQPQTTEWMAIPQAPSNCPPGLEYLTMIDQLLVKQKVEILEAIVGFETANKYVIKNSMGQKIYKAKEDTGCLNRNCCGPCRSFDMKIKDNSDNEVIHLYRPLRCDSCWFPCCLQELEVYAPPGNLVGTVKQKWSVFKPEFDVQNEAGDTVLKIKGPFCTWAICCKDVKFKVLSADGETEVGQISKHWSGLAKEMFTDADNFGITFPMDLDVRMKAVMLGACLLIDFMFFEKANNQESDNLGMW